MEKSRRGFAAMPREQTVAIAKMGGRARVDKGVGNFWTWQTATEAGRKGGLRSAEARRRRRAECEASGHITLAGRCACGHVRA